MMQRKVMQRLESYSLEDARTMIFSRIAPLGSERVPLLQALFRVLRQNLVATSTSPSHDTSTMDGYAVAKSSQSRWQVVGELPTGSPEPKTPLKPDTAVAVFTGSILPLNTFAVIPKENCSLISANTLTAKQIPPHQQYILSKGSDFIQGQSLLNAPRVITPRDISLAASLGFSHLTVSLQPKISIISSGSELVVPSPENHATLESGKIYASNGYGVAALSFALGATPLLEPPIADEPQLLKQQLQKAVNVANLVVTIGGASVGKYDLTKPVLRDLGADILFERVATRPGRPIFFAMCEGTPIIGLPGNPASATVGSWLYLADTIKTLCGLKVSNELELSLAKIQSSLPANQTPFDIFYRARIANTPITLKILERQESRLTYPTACADCLVLQKAYTPSSNSGSMVSYLAPPSLHL